MEHGKEIEKSDEMVMMMTNDDMFVWTKRTAKKKRKIFSSSYPVWPVKPVKHRQSCRQLIDLRSMGQHSSISTNNKSHSCSDSELLKYKLNFIKKVAIGSGHILNDLVGGLWFSYLLLYFQNITRISSASAGYLMLLGQIADAVATPLIGYEANEPVFMCKNYGRCKSWHLLGVILVLVSAPFVFLECFGCEDTDDIAKMIYYAPFIVVTQFGWAAVQIAHLALIPKASPDELVRTEIIAIRYAFTVGSNITIFILAYIFLGLKETLEPEDSYLFTYISLLSLVIGIVATIVFHWVVEEQPDSNVKRSVAFLNSLPSIDTRRMSISESLQCSTRTMNMPYNYRRRRSTMGKYSEEARAALLHRNSVVPGGVDQERGSDISFHLESGRHYESMASNNPNNSNSVLGHLQHSLQVINQSVQNLRPTNPLSTTWLSMGLEKMTASDWFKMFQFYTVLIIYMLTRLNTNLTQVYIPLYLDKSLKLSVENLATVPLTMYIVGLFATFTLKHLNRYVGRQLTFVLGSILCIIGSGMIWGMDWDSDPNMKKYGIFGVSALIGAGGSAMLVTSLSIVADLIGSNVESGAFVYAAMSFVDKLSCGLAISFINLIAPCQIDDGTCDQSEVVPFYRDSLAISCGGTAIFGIIGVIILTIKIYIQNRGRF